jgi:spermidine/putrescine transport system permease protein
MAADVTLGERVEELRPEPSRRRRRLRPGGGWLVVPPVLLVIVFLIAPIAFIVLFSLNLRTNVPGTATSLSFADWKDFTVGSGNPFRGLFVRSMIITLVVSISATVAAYPLAYFLAFVARTYRYTLLLVLLAPFFTSYLLRVLAWQIMLNDKGTITSALHALRIVPQNQDVSWLIYSNFSVGLVLFYSWIPFVALPIFAVLENMDSRLLEAAEDLGASRATTFWKVTFPLSLPGAIAGFVFVLIPTTGEFITPLFVGGTQSQMFGNSIQGFFSETSDYNYGSVLAITLIAVVVLLTLIFGRFLNTDLREPGRGAQP